MDGGAPISALELEEVSNDLGSLFEALAVELEGFLDGYVKNSSWRGANFSNMKLSKKQYKEAPAAPPQKSTLAPTGSCFLTET